MSTLTLDVNRVLGQTVASPQLLLNYFEAFRVFLPRKRGKDPPISTFSQDYPLFGETMHGRVATSTYSI